MENTLLWLRRERQAWAVLVLLVAVMYLLGAMPGKAAAGSQMLHGGVPAEVSRLTPVGRLPSAQRLNLAISLPLRNQPALADLLRQISNPASPNYRHYLTPAQFTERFGPTEADYLAVTAFAKAHGLKITAMHPNRTIVDVEGAVSDVENTFHVKMSSYQHPTEARRFYAPDTDPSVDLAVPILSITGLDNYSLPHPRYKLLTVAGGAKAHGHSSNTSSSPNSGSGPNGCYMGNDFRTAYVPGVSLIGTGQAVGLLEFDGYTTGDITYYENLAGLPNVALTNILLDGFSGAPTGDGGEVEVSLDIEMAISMAPGESNVLVYEAGPNGNWHDILNRMATDNLAKQLSCSWFIPDGTADPTADQIFQQMAAQGQSFFAASGDDDAYTGLIPFPDDTPYITEVGGTTLTTSGTGGPYASETVWNLDDGIGSSGGISTQYAIPSWQQGISMTANLGSTTMRNVPDVALTADNVYVRADGENQNIGGTSCAAPLWAAFTTLVNQQAVANTGTTVGFINPAVYAIGNGTNYTSAFHDTTIGNNFRSSSPAKFPAETGYDLCTGWGTPNGMALINALAGPPGPIITTGSSLPAGVAGTAYNQTLTASGGAMPYTWSISSGSLPTGLGLSSAGVISGTPTATGTASFTVQVTDSNSISSTTAFSLTIYPQGTPIIATSSPLPAGTAGGAYNQTLTASGGATPYTWSVSSGTLPQGLSLSSAGVISGTPSSTGTVSFTVQVTDNDGLSSTSPFSLTILPPPPVITSTLSATGTQSQTFSYQITATNSPTSYNATGLPTGVSVNTATGLISGTPTVNGTFNAAISATNAGGTGTATLVITVAGPPPVIYLPLTTLTSFTGTNGANPYAGLIQGSDGNFYGTTLNGGTSSDGTLFKLTPGGTLTTLINFNSTNGANPSAKLILGSDGNFYGATRNGGPANDGTLFKFTLAGTLTTLASFSSATGNAPELELVEDSSGNFYGTTTYNGASNMGTVYKLTPGGTLTALVSFSGANGANPSSGLILGADGNYYGDTYYGGSTFTGSLYTGDGTVFKITPGGTLTTVFNFNNTDGENPNPSLLLGSDGNFYGTTFYGGSSGDGTVFKLTPGGTLTTLVNFNSINGSNPYASLLLGGDWNFYGTTQHGGSSGEGTVYQLTPGGALTTLVNFNSTNGANPIAGLMQGSDGNFYGTTEAGGSSGDGTVFKLTPPFITVPLGNTVSYQITATNNPTSYAASGLPTGVSVNTATGLISGTPTVAGTFNVTISATNSFGTGSGNLTITVLTPTPVITSALSATGTNGVAFSYQITATNSPTSYAASGLPTGLSVNTSTGLISGTPTVTGAFNATISATNSFGTGSGNLTITVLPPPPVITSALSATGTQNQAFSYQITATNSPTSYGASGLPTGLSVNTSTGLISGTPSVSGTFNATISATSASGTGTATLVITLAQAPPVITSALSATGTNGVAFSYQITATNSPTSYAASGLPTGLSVNTSTGLISGTPTVTGAFNATISATNGSGTGSNTLTITVSPPPPVITSALSATGTQNLAFSYQITATNSPTSYAASGLPTGLSVNTTTGLISGMPTGSGTFNATISATNTGGTGTATLAITLTGVPPVIVTSFRTLRSFTGTNGAYPHAGLIQGSDGYFYGTTEEGGGSNDGTVFKVASGGTPSTLYSFIGPNGETPMAGLIQASDGNFYGTTDGGGSSGDGTVFKVTPGGSLTTLCSFTGANGANPEAGLIQGSDGNFYGTTNFGGSSNEGTVFKVTPAGVLTTLCSFTGANGEYPYAGLIQGSDGNFYGTTYSGGSGGYGTVFKVTPSGTLTTLCSFSGANGASPYAGLIQGSDGNFYGTTYQGGSSGDGSVFKMTPSGSLTTLCSFTSTNGADPSAVLMQGGDGNFYGTTSGGGGTGDDLGTVFELTPSGSLTTLNTFTDANGAIPYAGLIQGSDGKLYGTTEAGGSSYDGTVFNFTPFFVTGNIGSSLSYQIIATNNPTSYAASGLPTGVSVNTATGLISGTPTVTGTFNATISATNSAGTGSGNLTITVLGPLPVITSTLSATGTNGLAFSYQITATNNPTSYGASGLPTGLSVNTATGLISGTPAVSGTFNATISATNAVGTGTANLAVTITAPPPVITSALSATGTQSQTFSYQITATNSPTSYNASGLPTGISVNTTTGLISGTPTVNGTFNATISATNAGGTGTATLVITVAGPPPVIYLPLTTLASFSGTNGANPYAGLIQGSDGNFYGTTLNGGTSSDGTLFKLTPGGTLTTLINFNSTNGAYPSARLILGSDGNFYGATRNGGPANDGTLFKFTLAGTLTTLASFSSATGNAPELELVEDSSGNFYGTTTYNGASNMGTVYKLTPGGTLTALVSFSGANGANPSSGLILGADGNYYGDTYYGGSTFTGTLYTGDGTVYKVTPSGTETVVFNFNNTNGENPNPTLLLGSDGNFYGTTFYGGSSGGGTVFKVTPGGTLTTLVNFNSTNGSNPYGELFLGGDGNFYGTTEHGGSSGDGTVYQLTPGGGLTTLVNFNSTNGAVPFAGLIQGSDGNFYGTTSAGGSSSDGTVFKLTPSFITVALGNSVSYQITATNSPTSYAATGLPTGLSVNTSTGLISGTPTVAGTFTATISATNSAGTGSSNLTITVLPLPPVITSALNATGANGVAFSYQITATNNPTSYGASGLPAGLSVNTATGLISGTPTVTGTFNVTMSATNAGGTGTATLGVTLASPPPVIIFPVTTLISFTGTNGLYLYAGLIQGSDGNFYGVSAGGGSSGDGTVFRITPSGSQTTICTFTGANGANPYGGLIQGSDGNFYGTTLGGGSSIFGTVFKMTPGGSLTTLCSFIGTNGANPYVGVIQGSDGNFYGTTSSGGGSNLGTVFKVTPGGSLTTLCSFIGANGQHPYAGLIQGSDGNFYGTTYSGGSNNDGTVFKVTPGGLLTTLHSFALDGSCPEGGVIQGSDGNFYGTTNINGSGGNGGTVFKMTPSGSLTTLCTFTGANGANPYGQLFQGGDGNFYGTTAGGGSSSDGTVFMVTPSGLLTTLYTFTGANGLVPYVGLILGSDGNFYGTTYGGGSSGDGTVFKLTPPFITVTLGNSVSYEITATNNPASYGASGLPTGVSVNTVTGLINGTPTVTGTFNVTISATNSAGTGSSTLTITVQQTPAITSAPPPITATLNTAYNFTFIFSGFPAPTFSVTSGSLPPGLTLSSVGVIFGTPTTPGTYTGTVTASNGVGAATQNFTITIADTPADTPTMPPWGLLILAVLLMLTAARSLIRPTTVINR